MALATATGVVLAAPAAAQAADHAATRALLAEYQRQAGPGAAVYAGNRSGAWEVHQGRSSIAATEPIKSGEQFRAASQTETFVAAVVLQLADEDRIALDAPIERYLPGVVAGNGHDGTKITVRHLLQHTSGLGRDADGAQSDPDGTYRLRELVRAGLNTAPLAEPGTQWVYSNVGYYALGMLIEQLTGSPVGEVLAARIFEPLGMTRTQYPRGADTSLEAPYVHGYTGGRVGPAFFWLDITGAGNPSFWATAGAVLSTEEDLAKFERALADGAVVSAAALAEMRRTVPIPGSPGQGYGLGLYELDLSCGGQAWGHPGDLAGYTSATFATDDGRHAAVVTNTYVVNGAGGLRGRIIDSALCETPAG